MAIQVLGSWGAGEIEPSALPCFAWQNRRSLMLEDDDGSY